MLDLMYMCATIAFFALALLYVRFCARLGRTPPPDDSKP
jgi:hypothetical protein